MFVGLGKEFVFSSLKTTDRGIYVLNYISCLSCSANCYMMSKNKYLHIRKNAVHLPKNLRVMEIIGNSYLDFSTDEILTLKSYQEASKQMSFSFRDENNQHVFACVSLKKESLEKDGKGLRILEIKNEEAFVKERLFDRIYCVGYLWREEDWEHSFEYIWFYSNDIEPSIVNDMMEFLKFDYKEKEGIYIYHIQRKK